jgi:predicted DNA-binding ribbon-helix-helix protein
LHPSLHPKLLQRIDERRDDGLPLAIVSSATCCGGNSKVIRRPKSVQCAFCVIFATLQNSFEAATVARKFSVRCHRFATVRWGLFLMHTASLKSTVVKRSIIVDGHKTSISLEDAFWKGLKDIAAGRHLNLSDLIARIDSDREQGNLSSAIRLFVLDFYREQLSQLAANAEGHGQAGTRIRLSA